MSTLGGIRSGKYMSGRVPDRNDPERPRFLRRYFDGHCMAGSARPAGLVWLQSSEGAERRRVRRERR